MSTVYAILFVLLVVGGIQSQAATINYLNYPCDSNDAIAVMYPDYGDCTSFYQCSKGALTPNKCPAGQVADFAINKCVLAAAAILDCAKLTVGKP